MLTMTDSLDQSRESLRARLTPEQYRVTQEAGTERPFTGEYNDHFETGEYACVVCGEVLFASGEKFHSACGWPSFSGVRRGEQGPGPVSESEDRSHGMTRTEVTCGRCGAHLGHVFPDGPPPTGRRYCINSASLAFRPAGDG